MRLSAQQALEIFPTIWEYLYEIAAENVFNPVTDADMKELIASGKGTVFIEERDGEIAGCGIVRPFKYGDKWVAEIIYGKANDDQTWVKGLAEIEEWASSYKMDAVEINGRIGWERLLKGLNYSKVLVVMRKPLNE